MIDVYYFPSPNTWKVTIMLEECGLPYRIIQIDTLRGEQLAPQFRRISPNARVPAIVDQDTGAGTLERFRQETARLYGVLDAQLATADFITGEFSIADIACWSWVWFHELHFQRLADFPDIGRWFAAVGARPAVLAGRRVGLELVPAEQRAILEHSDADRKSVV